MAIKNQTALITGASSGIGSEIAKKFAVQGYSLLLLGRDEKRLKKVQAQCKNTRAEYLAFDLLDLKQNSKALSEKIKAMPPLTVLINNAGLFKQGLLQENTTADWLLQFQVNLLSAVELCKIVWPIFKKNKKGSIVNISSTLALKPTPGTGPYSAVKAAMINWTQSLAQEGGKYNIRANCICPGIVDTPIHAFHSMPKIKKEKAIREMAGYQLLAEIGEPTDVAEATYFLASELSKWTTGSVLSVDGGINIK